MSNGRRIILTLWERLRQWFNKIPWLWVMFWIGVFGIGLVFVTFVISLILHITGVWEWLSMGIPSDARNKYLLSATAQVLGAIFALVFSITLIATQFVTKYTHRTVWIVFNKWILIYVVGFATAVIFPLWWIVNPVGVGSFLSVGLGSLFVMSVPGFFLYLTQKMNINGIITELKRIGLEAMKKGETEKAKEMISSLDNIGMGSYTDRNFEVFEMAEGTLTDFMLGVEKIAGKLEEETPEGELHELIFSNLMDTCEEVIDNPRAPRIVIDEIGRVGKETLESSSSKTLEYVGLMLEEIDRLPKKDVTKESSVSSSCDQALYNILIDAPAKVFTTDVESESIDPIVGCYNEILSARLIPLYRKHLNREWKHWYWLIQTNQGRIENLLREYPPKDIVCYLTLFPLYCEYIDVIIKNNDAIGAHSIQRTIKEILPDIIRTEDESLIVRDSLTELAKYAEVYCNQPTWRDFWEWFWGYAASQARWALENDEEEIFESAQKAYLPALRASGHAPERIFPDFLEQNLSFFEKHSFYEERALEISQALKNGVTLLIQKGKAGIIERNWGKIRSLVEKLVKFGKDYNNPQIVIAIQDLLNFVLDKHAQNKLTLPRREPFQLAGIITIFRLYIAGHDLQYTYAYPRNLKQAGILQELLDEHQVIKKKTLELGVPEDFFESVWSRWEEVIQNPNS